MESLRNFLTGPRLFIVIAACALPFVFLGTSSLGSPLQSSFGSINGENVSQEDFNIATNRTIQKFQSIYGEDFDFNQLDEETQLDQIKQELIVQKVLLSQSRKLGLINSETVKNLAKNFKGKIVFLSTGSVYGAQEGILDESSEVNPLSEYASSKLIAEKYLADSDSIIFRLGTLFGIGDKFSRIRLDLVVNILTTKAYIDKKMSVFGGEQWRPLLHVKDVANAIAHTLDTQTNGVFNLHYKNFKIIEIANEIKNKISDVEIETTPLPVQDARNYQVSSDKLKDATGFQATVDLTQGINEMYELISSNRIKDINDPRYSNQNFLQKYGVK